MSKGLSVTDFLVRVYGGTWRYGGPTFWDSDAGQRVRKVGSLYYMTYVSPAQRIEAPADGSLNDKTCHTCAHKSTSFSLTCNGRFMCSNVKVNPEGRSRKFSFPRGRCKGHKYSARYKETQTDGV